MYIDDNLVTTDLGLIAVEVGRMVEERGDRPRVEVPRVDAASLDAERRGWFVFAALGSLLLVALWSSLALAATGTVAVNATILSNSNCRFRPPGATAALNFGALDPFNPVDVTRTVGMEVRCGGPAGNATYLIVDDDGLNESGPGAHRMVNGGAFLPYTFSYAPASATIPRNTNSPITITGTVRGIDYQFAPVGTYTDTVTLTIVP